MVEAQATVQALYDELLNAATSADPAAYAACFEPDAVLMQPHAPVVQGRDAIRSWAKQFFETYRLEISTFTIRAQVSGDRAAFSRYEATGRYVAVADASAMEFDQKYLDALVRRPDGSWGFAAHMWSSNVRESSIW